MEDTSDVRVEAGQSAVIDKLSAAMVAAQGEMTNPPKTKTVYAGQKKYSFAPLPEIIDAVRPVLTKHGLAVVQLVRERTLETRLVHQSGQWMSATYALPAVADSQAMGSAITYARRYSLCAILGIAAEDDEDGEAATAAELAEQDAKRKEAEKRLDALKGKGTVRSAYDGKVLAPGEPTLPAERIQPANAPAVAPVPPTAPAAAPKVPDRKAKAAVPVAAPDDLLGIARPLAELMRGAGISAEALKAYYVGKGHLPDTVEPTALPPDYVAGLIKPENWKKAVTAIKGGK